MHDITKVASERQIADLAVAAREIWMEHYVPIVGEAQIEYMLERFQSEEAINRQIAEGYEYYVVTESDESIGYIALLPNADDASLMISKIYVRSSARGRGIGKRMLEYAEDLCRQRGLEGLWLTVNKYNSQSIAWYTRMGFVNTGPVVQDIGTGFVMDDFRMEKEAIALQNGAIITR